MNATVVTFQGDSGSALACPHRDNPHIYVQAGITAWSLGCGRMNPSVHVSVPHFVNWIQEKMQARNLS